MQDQDTKPVVATPVGLGGMSSFEPNSGPLRVVNPLRNKPCPCGSGKKYKHCCRETRWLEDQAALAAARNAAAGMEQPSETQEIKVLDLDSDG